MHTFRQWTKHLHNYKNIGLNCRRSCAHKVLHHCILHAKNWLNSLKKKWKTNPTIMSKPLAHLYTMNTTLAKFKLLSICWWKIRLQSTHSMHLRCLKMTKLTSLKTIMVKPHAYFQTINRKSVLFQKDLKNIVGGDVLKVPSDQNRTKYILS